MRLSPSFLALYKSPFGPSRAPDVFCPLSFAFIQASISRDQIQRLESQGKTIREACRALDVSKSELFRIRKKFGMPRWVRNRSARMAKQAGAAARSAAAAAARSCRTSTSTTETFSTNEEPSAADDMSFEHFDSAFALSKDQLMRHDQKPLSFLRFFPLVTFAIGKECPCASSSGPVFCY